MQDTSRSKPKHVNPNVHGTEKGEAMKDLNLEAVRHTTGQLTNCSLGVVKYVEV
jgi:hypothetical protein